MTDRKGRIVAEFSAAKLDPEANPVVHETNKALTPEWVMHVVPDERLWGQNFTQVSFDDNPKRLPKGTSPEAEAERGAKCERAFLANTKSHTIAGETMLVADYVVPVEGSAYAQDEQVEGEYAFDSEYKMELKVSAVCCWYPLCASCYCC